MVTKGRKSYTRDAERVARILSVMSQQILTAAWPLPEREYTAKFIRARELSARADRISRWAMQRVLSGKA